MNQHCFLLDGKTILPINDNYQLLLPLKILNDNKYRLSEQRNHHCQYTTVKRVRDDDAKRQNSNNCKHNQQMNDIETYLITRILPTDSSSLKDKPQISPSAITIIIKPENPQKSFPMKRKSSSSSLQTVHKTTHNRLSTFKDITRIIPSSIPVNENKSSSVLKSGRLLNIYRNKKQKCN